MNRAERRRMARQGDESRADLARITAEATRTVQLFSKDMAKIGPDLTLAERDEMVRLARGQSLRVWLMTTDPCRTSYPEMWKILGQVEAWAAKVPGGNADQ